MCLLAKGDTKKAVEVLEQLDQTYPGVPIIKYELARAYLKNNNRIRQRWRWTRRSHSIPIMTMPCCCLLQTNISTGHGEMVIEPMTRLLKKRPDLRAAAFLLATAYGSLDRFDEATAVLQEQAKLTPQRSRAPESAWPDSIAGRKDIRKRVTRSKKPPNSRPDDLAILKQLVELDLLDKNFDAARQRIRRQFQKNPDAPVAHFLEGKILAAEGKWDLARGRA